MTSRQAASHSPAPSVGEVTAKVQSSSKSRYELALTLLQRHVDHSIKIEEAQALRYLKAIAPYMLPARFGRYCRMIQEQLNLAGSKIWQELYDWFASPECTVRGEIVTVYLETANRHYRQATGADIRQRPFDRDVLALMERGEFADAKSLATRAVQLGMGGKLIHSIVEALYARISSGQQNAVEAMALVAQIQLHSIAGGLSPSQSGRLLAYCAYHRLHETFERVARATIISQQTIELCLANINIFHRRAVSRAAAQGARNIAAELNLKDFKETVVKELLLLAPNRGELTEISRDTPHRNNHNGLDKFLTQLSSGYFLRAGVDRSKLPVLLQIYGTAVVRSKDLSAVKGLFRLYFTASPDELRNLPSRERLESLARGALYPQDRVALGLFVELQELRSVYARQEAIPRSKLAALYLNACRELPLLSIADRASIIKDSTLGQYPKFWIALLSHAATTADSNSLHWVLPLMVEQRVALTTRHLLMFAECFQRAESFEQGVSLLRPFSSNFTPEVQVAFAELLRKNQQYEEALVWINQALQRRMGKAVEERALIVRAQCAFHLKSPRAGEFLTDAKRVISPQSYHWLRLQCLRVYFGDRSLHPLGPEATRLLSTFAEVLAHPNGRNYRMLKDISSAQEELQRRQRYAHSGTVSGK